MIYIQIIITIAVLVYIPASIYFFFFKKKNLVSEPTIEVRPMSCVSVRIKGRKEPLNFAEFSNMTFEYISEKEKTEQVNSEVKTSPSENKETVVESKQEKQEQQESKNTSPEKNKEKEVDDKSDKNDENKKEPSEESEDNHEDPKETSEDSKEQDDSAITEHNDKTAENKDVSEQEIDLNLAVDIRKLETKQTDK